MNDFIHRGQPLTSHKIMGSAHKILEGPTHYGDYPTRKDGDLAKAPIVIPNKGCFIIFLDAAYRPRRRLFWLYYEVKQYYIL